MYRSLTAVLFCFFAQAAAAQCEAPASVAKDARQSAELPKKKPAAPGISPAKGELIKTAAAGTHEDARPSVHSAPPAPVSGNGDDEPRRGGPAMLLAALALMSGIALRRFGANK